MKMSIIELRDVLVRFLVLVFLLVFLGVILEGCTDKCETTRTYVYYEPVYSTAAEVRAAVKQEGVREIESSGKIYIYGNTLFVNEPGKGVHVIDNTDKRNPVPLSFLNIPGNFDIAAKGNFLYADSYIDVLAFDLTDIKDIKLVKRLENVYDNYTSFGFTSNEQIGIITDWQRLETVDNFETDCASFQGDFQPWRGGVLFLTADALASSFQAAESNNQNIVDASGLGGSMARFAITDNSLYAIDEWQMYVINIENLADPIKGNTVNIGWGIETIFPYKQHLFIGANNGMHIYDNTDPSAPSYLSTFMHFTACDPVVVNDQYAFVTLRTGNFCNGTINQLDVVNIEDLARPYLIKSYQMENPHGLGIDNNTLFLCEGEFGLKVFDIDDITGIDDNIIKHIDNVHAFDVIPFQNNLIMIGENGLHQYDYTDRENLELLSVIAISPPADI